MIGQRVQAWRWAIARLIQPAVKDLEAEISRLRQDDEQGFETAYEIGYREGFAEGRNEAASERPLASKTNISGGSDAT